MQKRLTENIFALPHYFACILRFPRLTSKLGIDFSSELRQGDVWEAFSPGARFLPGDAGTSVTAINHRYKKNGVEDKVEPPVKAPFGPCSSFAPRKHDKRENSPMRQVRICIARCLLLALALSSSRALAQDGKVTLEPREKWTNLAADSKIDLHFTVKGPPGFKGRVEWTFADAGTKRVFPRGRSETKIVANADKPVLIKVPLEVPAVKEGVALQAQLIVTVYADGKSDKEGDYEKTLWIFPADPFFNRTKWVEGLKITLYDSDLKSKTGEALKSLKVPFEEVRNPAALADLKEGLLLVGEGVSFKDEAGLAEAMVQAASRGVPVLCLSPKEGIFPLPGTDNGLPAPGSLTCHRQDVITKLDKRLDAAAWAPENQVVTRSLAIKTEDGKIIGDIQEGVKGWPWLQLDYSDKKGRLVLCCFPIIQRWDSSPTPRYLLARLLEHVTELSVNDSTK
jgi:hypothetical protein